MQRTEFASLLTERVVNYWICTVCGVSIIERGASFENTVRHLKICKGNSFTLTPTWRWHDDQFYRSM